MRKYLFILAALWLATAIIGRAASIQLGLIIDASSSTEEELPTSFEL